MMQPKVQVRMLSTGEVRALSARDAKIMVSAKKAAYLGDEAETGTYSTRSMEAAPAKRGPGRPAGTKNAKKSPTE